jgi:thiamine-monophosphate kinase
MTDIAERVLIERLAGGLARSPRQLNALHESDAELVRLPGVDLVLAVTTDAIVEEIAAGLYRDPYLAGWMIVAVNASDLAAVGAEPVGMVVSESLPPDIPEAAVGELQRGIREAAERHGLPLLGGDTNQAAVLALGATALGTVAADRVLTRRGAGAGDRLFASGPLGIGTAFAFRALLSGDGDGQDAVPFRPIARLEAGQCLPGIASACMDTSDGVIATLDELMRLNGVGVLWERPLADSLHPAALATARGAGLPPWTMLAGPHGEFELLFTVPPARRDELDAAAAAVGWSPLELGVVTTEPVCSLRDATEWLEIDTARIRNLFGEAGGDPQRYLRELIGPAAPRVVGWSSGCERARSPDRHVPAP